jgi:uncharacterized membrane protein YkvA (DUF1232 family)
MSELSRDDVIAVLGPLDDMVVAQIIATRVEKEGLIEAHKRVLRDREQHDPGPPLEPGPVARVIEILEQIPHDKLLASPFSTGVRMG